MQAETLQSAYTGGSVQDLPRHMLPSGSSWKLTDFIADYGDVPLLGRGGWTYDSSALGGATTFRACAWTPFSGNTISRLGVDDRGHVFSYDGTSYTDRGAAVIPIQRPVFFNELVYIFNGSTYTYGSGAGTSAPAVLTGTNIPSSVIYGLSYKSRLVLASATTVYFSNVLDATTWDVDSFVNPTSRLTGMAALSSMIMLFSTGACERLRGTIPPSSTSDGDMTLEPAFAEGCVDARSIVVYNDQVIWANKNGVHVSDGAAIDNMIELGGLAQYWETLMLNATSSWTFAGGMWHGRYIIAIMNGGTFVDCLMCNLAQKSWSFLSNMTVEMFAERLDGTPELYGAMRTTNRIGRFGTMFTLAGSLGKDGDGSSVQPVIEYPFFRMGTDKSRWRDIFIGVDIDTTGVVGTPATLSFAVTTYPDDLTYQAVNDDSGNPITIGATTGYEKHRIPLHLKANGIGLKITQSNLSKKTAIFDLEAEVRPLDGLYQ